MYTELWQVIGLQSEEAKKCSLQKLFLPLFSFLQEKVRELEDAESEQQKVLGPLTYPGEWGVTGLNSLLLSWLAARVVCNLVSEAWESTQILHVCACDK